MIRRYEAEESVGGGGGGGGDHNLTVKNQFNDMYKSVMIDITLFIIDITLLMIDRGIRYIGPG